MRLINFLLAIIFLVIAFVGVNEPSPVVWILINGSMAIVCIMAMYQVFYKSLLALLVAASSVYCFFLFPGVRTWFQQENICILFDEEMKLKYLYIQETRQFLNLIICLIVLIFHFFQSLRIN